jgi:hypothetical protein
VDASRPSDLDLAVVVGYWFKFYKNLIATVHLRSYGQNTLVPLRPHHLHKRPRILAESTRNTPGGSSVS